ncbi:MAG: 3-hydroxybutyryl-CoA dehydrogenase [Myxococcota bacterium]
MEIKKVGVIGAGQMGNGIAQVAAFSGFEVVMTDISEESLSKGVATIERSLGRLLNKDRITAEARDAALSRIATHTQTDHVADCDIVIEAATEAEAIKFSIFRSLDAICKPEAILASNTSSISITRIAAETKRPGQVVGMHFMNPVPIMKLVELIRGLATTDATYEATQTMAQAMGKTTVVAEDYPGFLVNRVLMPYINEAAFVLMEGIGSVEDIDNAMKLGTNVPMGPLTLADFIGLDTCLAIMEVLHQGLGDSKYRPCPLLRKYVDAGWLGRKSGRGFYTYGDK